MKNEYRWLTPESLTFLERDYLLPGQTLDQRVDIICQEAEKRLGIKDFAKRFKEIYYTSTTACSVSTRILFRSKPN